jgi:gluconokinase
MTSSPVLKTTSHRPFLLVVMGVSGTGKSTLADAVAEHFAINFLDADSLHSTEAKQQMSQGIALTDQQRDPWIARICEHLKHFQTQGESCVLAYSGLKKTHRKLIFDCYQHSLGILLKADKTIIAKRLQSRAEHFMSPQLLDSQMAAMEDFDNEIILLELDLRHSLEQHLAASVSLINQDR